MANIIPAKQWSQSIVSTIPITIPNPNANPVAGAPHTSKSVCCCCCSARAKTWTKIIATIQILFCGTLLLARFWTVFVPIETENRNETEVTVDVDTSTVPAPAHAATTEPANGINELLYVTSTEEVFRVKYGLVDFVDEWDEILNSGPNSFYNEDTSLNAVKNSGRPNTTKPLPKRNEFRLIFTDPKDNEKSELVRKKEREAETEPQLLYARIQLEFDLRKDLRLLYQRIRGDTEPYFYFEVSGLSLGCFLLLGTFLGKPCWLLLWLILDVVRLGLFLALSPIIYELVRIVICVSTTTVTLLSGNIVLISLLLLALVVLTFQVFSILVVFMCRRDLNFEVLHKPPKPVVPFHAIYMDVDVESENPRHSLLI